ncbi:MAG: GGDEF domain-containing protein [Aquabacterium sp.]|nr:MAG: GGDEF domain-containing protein [Aquabacterium sp.]
MDATTIFPLTATGTELAFRRSRSASRSFWLVLTRATLAAAAVHILFTLLFWALSRPALAWLNLGSVVLYLVACQLLRQRHNSKAVLLIWLEVHVHVALAVHGLGWDSGFHYYLLTFIPIIFVSSARHVGVKVMSLVVLCSFYMLLDAYMHDHIPTQPVAPLALAAVRYFNIGTTFLILGYLTWFYLRQVSEAERRLRRMAATDSLTGLANRRRAQEIAHYEIVKRRRGQAPLAFVLADIDHFKTFNDRHGHETGDRVLEAVADVLRDAVREQDCVARWGGEEFLVLLPQADLAMAQRVAERMRQSVAECSVHAGDQRVAVTMTFGVAVHRGDEEMERSIARADAALYVGKRMGRNCVIGEAA